MKKIISALLFLSFLSGCATTGPKLESDEDPVQIIKLPKSNKNSEIQNMKDARKNLIKIGTQGTTSFDFYFNDSGGYYVVPVQTGERKMDLSLYDATLVIDEGGEEPEYVALALENNQILSGFGIPRSNRTKFKLMMTSSDSSLAQSFNFSFNAELGR